MGQNKNAWFKSTPGNGALTIAPEAGDFLVAWSITDGSYTVTTPTDWTPVGTVLSTTVDGSSMAVFVKRATGAETSVQFVWTSYNNSIDGCASYANINVDSPLDVAAVYAANNSAATTVDTSITPATDGSIILYIVGADGPSGTYTWTFSTSAGTTGTWSIPNIASQTSGFHAVGVSDCVQTTAGALTAHCEINNSAARPVFLLALRKAGNTFNESLTDTLTADEAATGNLGAGSVSLADNVSVAEHAGILGGFFQRNFFQPNFFQVFGAPAGGTTYTEPVGDTVAFADALGHQTVAKPGVAEAHTVAESPLGAVRAANQGLSDSDQVDDGTVTGQRTAFGSVGDNVSAADNLGASVVANQGLIDSCGIVEALLAQGKSIQAIGDSVGLADAQTIGILLSAALADAVNGDGSVGAAAKALQDLGDAIGVSEGVSSGGSTTHTIGLEDSASVAEAVSAAYTVAQTIAEAHGLSDDLATKLSSILGLADAVSRIEGVTGGLQAVLTMADAISNFDSLLASRITVQGLADSLGLVESQAAGIVLSALLSDAIRHDESILSVAKAIQDEADALSLGDSISAGGSTSHTITLEDGTSLSDQMSGAVRAVAGIGEAVSFADALGYAIKMAPVLADSLGLDESQTVRLSQIVGLADDIAGAASVTESLRVPVSVLDQCQAADSLAAGLQTRVDLDDSAGSMQASVAAFRAAYAELSDVLTNSDFASASVLGTISAADAIVLAAATSDAQAALAGLRDSIAYIVELEVVGGVPTEKPDLVPARMHPRTVVVETSR